MEGYRRFMPFPPPWLPPSFPPFLTSSLIPPASPVICGINLALTTFTFALPWWTIECWKNCDEKHYTVELDIGICSVGKTGGFSESNCIQWKDTKTWEEIDEAYGTNTAHAARYIYPRVYKLTVISLCLSLLSLLISFFSLYQHKSFPKFPIILSQIFVIITATAFQIVVISAQSLGSHTSITDEFTWREYTDCSQSYDAPFYAYYTFAATQTLTLLMTFVAISPNRCRCFHLVAHDDNIEAMQSFSSQTLNGGSDATIATAFSDPRAAYYDSGIDYRMSLALNPELLSSYSPPKGEDSNIEKI